MKKLGYLFVAAVLLTGCGSSATPTKGEATATNSKGQTTTVKVTKEGDKITALDINETYVEDGKDTTKKDLKEGYNMKAASSISKEWYEQIAFLEDFIVKNGIDKVGELTAEEGKPTNPDVLTGCTMGIKDYITSTEEAVKNAK